MKTRQQIQSACPVCGASLPHTHPTAIERCRRIERQQTRQGECVECGRFSSQLTKKGYCEGCVMQAEISAMENKE